MKRILVASTGMVLITAAAWLGWSQLIRHRGGAGGGVAGPINVLLITLDTTRADRLGCYGYAPAETPALDKLAAEGTRFANAFTHVPLTLPSHATILTGLLPPEHGLRDNGRGRLGSKPATLAEQFAAHGYRTAAFVASFVLDKRFGLDRGFAQYDDRMQVTTDLVNALKQRNRGDVVADRALAWLGGNSDQPFFAWVHFYDPHSPYDSPEPYWSRHAKQPYDGAIAFADAQVKRLFDSLDSRGLRNRTLVIVCGDHGESFGEHEEFQHGALVYDSTMRVPLIVRLPGRVAAGKTDVRVAGLADIAPTILQVMGWKPAGALSGTSLLADPPAGRACYGESEFLFYNYGWAALRSLTGERWKYIDCPEPELYDLAADRGEASNVLAGQRGVAAEMKGRLDKTIAAMTAGQAEQVALDREAIAALRALGYLGGAATTVPTAAASGAQRLNPRTMMPVFNAAAQAERLLDEGKFADAIELLKPLAGRSSDSPAVSTELATAYISMNRWSEAKPCIETVLRLEPGDRAMWFNLGTALLEEGKPDEAAKVLRQALRLPRNPLEPGNPDGPSAVTGSLRMHLGVALMRLKQYDQAIEQYNLLLAKQPNNAVARNNLAVVYLELGKFDQAANHAEAAYSQLSKNFGVVMNLAEARERSGQTDGAIRLCRDALAASPRDPTVAGELGIALCDKGQYDQAIEVWKESAAAHPDHPHLSYNLAWLLATCPDPAVRRGTEAIVWAEALKAKVTPLDSRTMDALAAAYAETGRFAEAAEAGRKALELAAARADKDNEMTQAIERRAALYAAGKAYHQPPGSPMSFWRPKRNRMVF